MNKFLFVALLFLISCGESPLFNHKMEKSGIFRNLVTVESEGIPFKKVNYTFAINWMLGPQLGESKFSLKAWQTNLGTFNGPYIDLPYELKVVLWMPSMGHGSSPTKVTKLASGEYEVSDIYFIMGGSWDLKIQLIKDGKMFDEVVLPYTL